MASVSVCFSTDLIVHHGDLSHKHIVIIDILRATSCMLTAFMEGADSIKAFDDLEKCSLMKSEGYLIAGERDGKKVEGFDLGNSPYDYLDLGVKGKKIAMTTTNGTKALIKSSSAESVYIGSFLNVSALTDILIKKNSDVLLFCAGWKGRPNSEDTLFAGMVISKLIESNFELDGDEALISLDFFTKNERDIYKIVKSSAHALRLSKHTDIESDLKYCSLVDESSLVPYFKDGEIRCR